MSAAVEGGYVVKNMVYFIGGGWYLFKLLLFILKPSFLGNLKLEQALAQMHSWCCWLLHNTQKNMGRSAKPNILQLIPEQENESKI